MTRRTFFFVTAALGYVLALTMAVAAAGGGGGGPDHLRQGYGGPPKLYAKVEARHYC